MAARETRGSSASMATALSMAPLACAALGLFLLAGGTATRQAGSWFVVLYVATIVASSALAAIRYRCLGRRCDGACARSHSARVRWRFRERSGSPAVTSLSVVIPVFNEAKRLLRQSTPSSSPSNGADSMPMSWSSTTGPRMGARTSQSRRSREGSRHGWSVSRTVGDSMLSATGSVRPGGDYVLVLGARVAQARRPTSSFGSDRRKASWCGLVMFISTPPGTDGTFQNVLTEIAWREYFDDPRPVAFGAEEFDRYPKGSGCFVAPREVLLEAFQAPPSRYADIRYANDDTPMLRSIAVRQPIHVAPGFASD